MNITCTPLCPRTRRMYRNAGFTLIELMVVIAIVGVLVMIAMPSYRAYVERGDRASARAGLMDSQQFLERFYAANDRYDQDKAGTAVSLPQRLQAVPQEAPRYNLTISSVASNGYTLTATPITSVSKCGNLILAHTGEKSITNPASPTQSDIAACWK